MTTYKYTRTSLIDSLREKNIVLFTPLDLKKLFTIQNYNSLRQMLTRLVSDKIIERLIKGKYLFSYGQKQPSDFEIANFLVVPSYISLESALSLYGMIDQFPYRISSLTPLRPRQYKVRGKIFSYSGITKNYFKGFVKNDDFLIASKEKVIFDYFYFVYKGLRSLKSLDELTDFLRKREIFEYLSRNADKNFLGFIKKHVKF